MTYLVMENHLSYSVVLDERGQFLKVANMGYEIGETLDKVFPMELVEEKEIKSKKPWIAFGTIAACLLLIFTTMFRMPAPVTYASIYMIINPEVKIDVDESGKVVALEPMNDDGKTLIENYKWEKKDMNGVSKELLDKAIELGFLSEGGNVTINIDSPDEEWYKNTGIAFRKNLDGYLSERISVTIEINSMFEDEVDDDEEVQKPVIKEETVKPKPIEKSNDSDYGDSDYGDSDYGNSDYDERQEEIEVSKPTPKNDSDYEIDESPERYEDEDSNYDDDSNRYDNNDSNYDDSDYDDN